MEQFWMVWNEWGQAPTVKHLSPEAAREEAARLARANPGQSFHVLSLVVTCQIQDIVWRYPTQTLSAEPELPW